MKPNPTSIARALLSDGQWHAEADIATALDCSRETATIVVGRVRQGKDGLPGMLVEVRRVGMHWEFRSPQHVKESQCP
jgi:hypothetical protein